MPYCTTCGSAAEGRFCVKCGTPLPASPAPQPAAAAPALQPAAAAPAPARKKTSPIVWILLIVGGLIVLAIGSLVAGGMYFAHKVKQNPGLAMTKLLTAANPDVEVLSTDEDRGIITLREKKTGKVLTVNFEDIKRGKIVFSDDGKESVTLDAGGDAKMPDWVPAYPGAKAEGSFSLQATGNDGGSVHFTTDDAASKVLSFYRNELEGAGFTVGANVPSESGGMITAEDAASKRSVMVTISSEAGRTGVHLIFGVKK